MGAGAGGGVVTFRARGRGDAVARTMASIRWPTPTTSAASCPVPLLIGGALTSAAISIAGAAAYVAWRWARPGRGASPMVRAARAVRTRRSAAR